MRNAGLEETQAGIKIVGRNINTLRYADDTILMAESDRDTQGFCCLWAVGSSQLPQLPSRRPSPF